MSWKPWLATVVVLVGGAVAMPVVAPGRQTAAPAHALVKIAVNKQLKASILVDARGRTLYLLASDTSGVPTCAKITPDCPKIWPALTSAGQPRAGKGVNARLLGIARGAGGSRQVTYNRHPLYFYVEDAKAGAVNGQACYGIWFVVSPKGAAIRKPGPHC